MAKMVWLMAKMIVQGIRRQALSGKGLLSLLKKIQLTCENSGKFGTESIVKHGVDYINSPELCS